MFKKGIGFFLEECFARIVVHFYTFLFLVYRFGEFYLPHILSKGLWKPFSYPWNPPFPPDVLFADPDLGTHRYLKISDVKYHYVESGSSRDPLLLCLHDFGDFWYGYRHQLRSLKSGGLWVVAPDLKGFGDSDKPLQKSLYKMENVVLELREFILSLNKKRCLLMGDGLGAYIAWHFSSAFPDMVDGFIAVDGPHPKVLFSGVVKSWKTLSKNKWMYLYRLPYIPEYEMLANKDFFSKKERTPMDIEAYKYTYSRRNDWTGPINYIRNFPLHLSHIKLEEKEPSVLLPIKVLFINGSDRNESDFELVCRSLEYVEKFSVQIIDNAGNSPHQSHPETVNNKIRQFLNIPLEDRKRPHQVPSINANGYDESSWTKTPPARLLESLYSRITSLTRIGTPEKISEITSLSPPISCQF